MEIKLIPIDIVSPHGLIFKGEAKTVIVRGSDGELGVSYGHSQLITYLPPGPLRVVLKDDNEELLYVSGGIFEVQPKRATVLADVIERAQDINENEAIKSKQRAEKLLSGSREEMSFDEAQKILAESEARLKVLEIMKSVKIN